MSRKTRTEVLAKKRARYARAGKEHKTKIINELVELFDYHRKAAIRAMQARPVIAAPFVIGWPKEYDPDPLRAPLKAIWLAALQPCGVRLKACLPDWLPAYEEDHRRLDADVHSAAQAATTGFGVRGLVRAFGRRLVAVERERGVRLFSRAAGRGPALATSRQSGESGDKSFSLRTFWEVISRFLFSTTYGIRCGCKIISASRS